MIKLKLAAILKPFALVYGISFCTSSLSAQAPTPTEDAPTQTTTEPATQPVAEPTNNQPYTPPLEEDPSDNPNVILIITDDQGWGDFSSHGNTIIETPHLDQLAKNSINWQNFYVSPVCSPTRASLMTGRYNQRTKCLDTYLARSMMATDEVTIAEALKGAGYATGIFGKWHLGDNYPMRPSDQGFEYSFIHKGGGLGQPSDPIENKKNYTNPILFRNNSEITTKGYCTDLFFDEAIKFISNSVVSQRPFFAYIATNAPHAPFHDVPQDLLEHYQSKDIPSILPDADKADPKKIDQVQRIAAMITNIDQNVGKLINNLETNKLLENTLIIYLNDNGPNTQRYTGDFKGVKGSVSEGGIRSPLWIHWPARFKTSQVITSNTAAHIDIMPTIMDACDLGIPEAFAFDGRSLLEKLDDPAFELAPRPVIIQAHRGASLVRYHNFMIRDQQWKLSNNSGFGNTRLETKKPFELYDLNKDPSESNNIAAEHPDEVKRLTLLYNTWYDDVTMTRIRDKGIPDIIVQKEKENPLVLTWQERISQNWGIQHDGYWKLFFSTQTRADIIVYSPTDQFMGDKTLTGFTPILQIGSQVYKAKPLTNEKLSIFEGINIPKGKRTLHAKFISEDESEEIHAYQIRLSHR